MKHINNISLFGKLTQKFGMKKQILMKHNIKVIFTIQGDYTNNKYTYDDPNHGDNLFHYGYVGKFNTYKAPIYQNGSAVDSLTGTIYNGRILRVGLILYILLMLVILIQV